MELWYEQRAADLNPAHVFQAFEAVLSDQFPRVPAGCGDPSYFPSRYSISVWQGSGLWSASFLWANWLWLLCSHQSRCQPVMSPAQDRRIFRFFFFFTTTYSVQLDLTFGINTSSLVSVYIVETEITVKSNPTKQLLWSCFGSKITRPGLTLF